MLPRPLTSLPQSHRIWQQLSSRLLWVYDGLVPGALLMTQPKKEHHLVAWFIRRGGLHLESTSGSTDAGPGQWVVPTTLERSVLFEPGSTILSIRSSVEWSTGQPVFPILKSLVLVGAKHPELEQAGRLLAEWESERFSSSYFLESELMDWRQAMELSSLHLQWLQTLTSLLGIYGIHPQPLAQPDERIHRALEAIQLAPLHQRLDRNAIAVAAGLSVSQVDRMFSTEIHRSPASLHEERRIGHACDRLASLAGGAIKEIAADLGFNNLAAFSQWFARHKKMAPSLYRSKATGMGHALPTVGPFKKLRPETE